MIGLHHTKSLDQESLRLAQAGQCSESVKLLDNLSQVDRIILPHPNKAGIGALEWILKKQRE